MESEEIAKISIDRFAEQLGKAEAVLFWQHLERKPQRQANPRRTVPSGM
jgi:hypothetical protein